MKKAKKSGSSIVGLVMFLLFVFHLFVVAGDVQAIVDDPRKESKPAELLKLAFDFTRYFG